VNQEEHEEEEHNNCIHIRIPRIVRRTITKKITSESMIAENKGMERPTDKETSTELLQSWREGVRIWR
jgi:hypothetical protein